MGVRGCALPFLGPSPHPGRAVRNCLSLLPSPSFLRFRSKYHPDEVGKRRQEARGALQNRLKVFLSLMEGGWFENLLLDIDKADAIVKLLDAGTAVRARGLGWH